MNFPQIDNKPINPYNIEMATKVLKDLPMFKEMGKESQERTVMELVGIFETQEKIAMLKEIEEELNEKMAVMAENAKILLEMTENQENGFFRLVYNDGAIFEGINKNGFRNGWGRYIDKNGNIT
jgi:hypothetical protein